MWGTSRRLALGGASLEGPHPLFAFAALDLCDSPRVLSNRREAALAESLGFFHIVNVSDAVDSAKLL